MLAIVTYLTVFTVNKNKKQKQEKRKTNPFPQNKWLAQTLPYSFDTAKGGFGVFEGA
jgi:hypothetical protein